MPFFQLIDRNEKNYRLKDLKKLTKAYKPGEIKKELWRHRMLSELSVDALGLMEKLKLSDGNIRYFATRCQQYDISRLRELKREKALIYLTCFVTTRLRISNDSLTQSFLLAYKDFNDQAVAYRDEQVKQQALVLLDQIEKVPQVLNLFVDNTIEDSDEFGTVRRRAFNLIARDQLPLVSQNLAKVKPDKAVFQWDYIDTHFAQVTRNIRPLLLALDFGCRGNTVLERHITTVKATLKLHPPSPPIDGRLVKQGDKKYLTIDSSSDENDKRRIANRHEMYLYKLLNTALHNGDLYVKNSLEFRSFDDYLVNDAIWRQRNKYLHEAGLGWKMQPSGDYLATLKDTLGEKNASVGQRIAAGKNTYIKRKPNSDTLLWSRAVTPKDHTLTERFFAHFDRETIVNVVREVNEETGFLEHFKPTTTPAITLGRRTVQQSTLVKKLCGYQQHNATMLALAEYNRVFKCLHLLDYANDKQLRQVIQESLNRGESVQGLKRALASLGGNQFRGRNPEEMAMWNSCANLLTNCIVYYNALIMSSYKSYCLDAGNEDQIKHLRLIPPA
ncbi:MAG: hypothetical protein DRQ98_04715, partial [Gammaproteobacteria bacterium]